MSVTPASVAADAKQHGAMAARPGYSSVADRARTQLPTLSPSARKVARILLADYPVAGLETAAAMAERARVSTPTVIRFVAQLGFPTFGEFQSSLLREVQASLGSPARQYARRTVDPPTDAFLRASEERVTQQVASLFRNLSPQTLATTSRLLMDPQRRVTLSGGRFSHLLAGYLGAHLRMLRPSVAVVGNDEIHRLDVLASVRRGDVLVIFDYRRYDADLLRLTERFAGEDGRVVLFTDPWLSPIVGCASEVITSDVSSMSPFDSLVPAMVAVETVVASLTHEAGEVGRRRVEAFDRLRKS